MASTKKQAAERAVELLNTAEAAEYMQVAPTVIENLAATGALECLTVTDGTSKAGLGRRFAVEELERRRYLIRPDTI
jgi:hypothetical protein